LKTGALIILGFLFVFFAGFVTAIDISDCGTLDSPNTYYNLTADVDFTPGYCPICLNVTATNVTLNCNNHLITTGNVCGYGIFVNSSNNFTMAGGCNITGWGYGVYVSSSNNTNVGYSDLEDDAFNIMLSDANNTAIQDNLIHWGWHGIVVENNNDNIFIRRNNFLTSDMYFGIGWASTYANTTNTPHTIILEDNNFTSYDGFLPIAISIDGNYSNITIRNNTVDMRDGCGGCGYQNVIIFNPAAVDVNPYPATIYNNSFYGNGGAGFFGSPVGIEITSSYISPSYPSYGLNVSNNFFDGVDWPIYFAGIYPGISFPANVFQQNTINNPYVGALINNMGNQVFLNNIINNSRRYGFYLYTNDLGVISENDVIINSSTDDVVFGDFDFLNPTGGTIALFLNTSFNKSAVVFNESDSNSNMTVLWFVDARVVNGSTPIAGAYVNVTDAYGVSLFNETTNATGWIPQQIIAEYFQDNVSITNYTPHQFNVTAAGYGTNSTLFAITGSGTKIINYAPAAPSPSPSPSVGEQANDFANSIFALALELLLALLVIIFVAWLLKLASERI